VLNLWQTGNLSLVTIGVLITPGCYFFVVCCWDYINIVSCSCWWLRLVIHLAGQSTPAGQDAVLRGRATKGSQIPPSQQVKQKIHGKRQMITKPAQSPLNVDVVPIPDEDMSAIRGIFGIDTFFATETIPIKKGQSSRAICAESQRRFTSV